MKITYPLIAALLLALTGCSTTHSGTKGAAAAKPETVLVTYHVQVGKEPELEAALLDAWEIYRSEHMVVSKPHVIVQENEGGGYTRFVEVFTWVKAPDHAPDRVKAMWNQEQSLCEARNGRTGIEGGEVKLVTGK
jgi:hypothetical protein